ncbi:hypothetical protein [Thioflavicoccus mobilis]|nr:hypothetical protein [Thioflavicoccus mobilis]
MMHSTEQLLPEKVRTAMLVFMAIGAAFFMIVLAVQGSVLKTPEAPWGIVSLELAWSTVKAEAILGSWSDVTNSAQQQIFLDFPFIVFYSLSLSLFVAFLSRGRESPLTRFGAKLSWVVLMSAPLDVCENLAMLFMLSREPTNALVLTSSVCAALKFALVLSVFVFAFVRLVCSVARCDSGAAGVHVRNWK